MALFVLVSSERLPEGGGRNSAQTEVKMLSIRNSCLLILFGMASVAALGQESKPKRELDVPYVPTPEDVVEGMLKTAAVTKNDVLYDLGCGDGRIVITAAQKFGTHGVGIDIDPNRIKEARANAEKAGVTGLVKFVEQDLFESSIGDASVVTLYLLPSINLKLRPKLLHDLKPGTRIVSHSFDMGDWKPEKQLDVNGQTIYYWVIPARKASYK
jgi:SAM-dependent methyltransferase